MGRKITFVKPPIKNDAHEMTKEDEQVSRHFSNDKNVNRIHNMRHNQSMVNEIQK